VQFQADLVDMSAPLKENDNITFLLTCIDVFSKYAWARPLKNKTGKEVTKAFESIYKENHVTQKLQTDKGTNQTGRVRYSRWCTCRINKLPRSVYIFAGGCFCRRPSDNTEF